MIQESRTIIFDQASIKKARTTFTGRQIFELEKQVFFNFKDLRGNKTYNKIIAVNINVIIIN